MTWTPATTPPPAIDPQAESPRSRIVLCSCSRLVRHGEPARRFYRLAIYRHPAGREMGYWSDGTSFDFDITDEVVAWQDPEEHPPTTA